MKRLTVFTLMIACFVFIIFSTSFDAGVADDRVISVTQDVGITLFRNGIPVATTKEDGTPEGPILYAGTTYIREYGLEQLFGINLVSNGNTVNLTKNSDAIMHELVDLHVLNKDTTTVKKPNDALNNSKSAKATVVKDITLNVSGVNTPISADCLRIDGQLFLPLRDIATAVGWKTQWNVRQRGVDIMSPDFFSAVESFLKMESKDTHIPKDDLEGLRYYILANIFQDSPTSVVLTNVLRKENGVQNAYLRVAVEDVSRQLEHVKANDEKLKDIVNSLKLSTLAPRERVRKINQYVCNKFVYDYNIDEETALMAPRKLSDILSNEKQICEGYARLFTELCKRADVPAQYLVGYIKPEGTQVCHAWSRVFIDGKWLYCDPTTCDSSKNSEVALLLSEKEMIKIHQETNRAIRY